MKKNIGIWMYQNGGGDAIVNELVHKLTERGFQVYTDLNLRDAEVSHDGIYCMSRSGDKVRMDTLDLFFTYNAGEQNYHQVYLYEYLNRHVPIINSFAGFALTEDKFRTNLALRKSGITTPDFNLVPKDHAERLHQVFNDMGQQLVTKPLGGWGGMGVNKIESENALKSLIAYTQTKNSPWIYVEELIDYDKTDYRVDIVNGQYIGCYGRKATNGSWKTNITSGGCVFLREPSDEIIDISIQAAKVTGLDVAGVDIIYDRKHERPVVLEVNGIPAFATPEQVQMGLDFNHKKIDLLVELIVERTASNVIPMSQVAKGDSNQVMSDFITV